MASTDPYSQFPDFLVTFPPSPDPSTPARSIALIEINRPRQLNSWTRDMFQEYKKIWEILRVDRDVRVVILAGAGDRAFSAGLDLKTAGAILGGGNIGEGEKDVYRRTRKARLDIRELQDATAAGEGSGKPLICLLNGYCFGLALDLACTADIRIATTGIPPSTSQATSSKPPVETTLSIKEIDIGIAADLGVLTRLPKLIGSMSFLKYHALTGLPFTPQAALEQGFVSEVVQGGKNEGLKRCMQLAALICTKSPVAIEGIIGITNQGLGRPVEEGLEYTAVWNSSAILSTDVGEAVAANVGKRRGRFEKL